MPRIEKSRVSSASPRGFVPRAADTSAIGDALTKFGAQLTAAKEREDLSYLAGKNTQALLDWDKKKQQLDAKYGSDSRRSVEEFNEYMTNYTADLANNAPNAATSALVTKSLNTMQFSTLKTAITQRNASFQKKNTELLKQDTQLVLGMVKNDWTNAEDLYMQGMRQINAALWMNEEDRLQAAHEFEAAHRQEVISGWFASQNNKLGAVRSLSKGTSPVNVYYQTLGLDEKRALTDRLTKEFAQETRLENDLIEQAEKADKRYVQSQLRKFYDFQNTTTPERQQIIDDLKVSKTIDPDRILKMQQLVAGADTIDNQENIFHLKQLIRKGELRSLDQLVDVLGDSVSFETASKELAPLIQAQQDKRFSSAYTRIRTAINLPPFIEIDPNRITREQNTALMKLDEFFIKNPDGDLNAAAESIIEEYEKAKGASQQLNLQRQKDSLKTLEEQYKTDPSRTLKNQIQKLRAAIGVTDVNN